MFVIGDLLATAAFPASRGYGKQLKHKIRGMSVVFVFGFCEVTLTGSGKADYRTLSVSASKVIPSGSISTALRSPCFCTVSGLPGVVAEGAGDLQDGFVPGGIDVDGKARRPC